MSTDTPRTDERLWKSENIVDGWDFCRTLERENAKLQAACDQKQEIIDSHAIVDKYRIEVEEQLRQQIADLRESVMVMAERNAVLRQRVKELEAQREELRLAVATSLHADTETWPAHGNVELAVASLIELRKCERNDIRHEFQNFHRALCERFGYRHDVVDWRRDQVSLIEHIAKERDAAVRDAPDAARYRYLCSHDKEFSISQNIGHDWITLFHSFDSIIDAAIAQEQKG